VEENVAAAREIAPSGIDEVALSEIGAILKPVKNGIMELIVILIIPKF
jgi:L-galactose dehydrogenase